MIQELLGGGSSLLGGSERKISFNGAILEGSPCPPPPTATTTTTNTPPPDQQNLRCPRCDSSNTKFCYYNNYNLTQPRHFCKTCRRYWTKGGALRNVPIGGGCRKNKTTTTPTTAAKSSTSGKIKPVTDISKPSFGFDHDPSSNPILWASPQNSQLLALLRASQNPNPNPSSGMIKEEGTMIGSHMTSSDLAIGSGALNARPLSLDPLSQVPLGLCSSFWKTNQHQQQQQPPQHHHQNQNHNQNQHNHQNQSHNHNHNQNQHNHQTQQHGLLMGDAQNSGIQELYQRLRSSVSYYSDHSPAVMSNAVSSSPTSTSIMEPSPISTSELGYWNPTLSWSNLPATHGAFP